jgi:hypothetical protein
MKRVLFAALLAAAFATPASGEVEKFININDGNLRPMFRLKFTPPEGWLANSEGTRVFGLPVYVRKGENFHHAPAVIYIRVSYNENKRPIEAFIEVSQERWRNKVKDTQVNKVEGEKRANGLPDFIVYRIHNPSLSAQAYEMLAYGVDKDKDGNDFFVMISMTAMTQKAIDDAEAAYRSALRAH